MSLHGERHGNVSLVYLEEPVVGTDFDLDLIAGFAFVEGSWDVIECPWALEGSHIIIVYSG